MTLRNGDIPESLLVTFYQDGIAFKTSPYALQQWRALVADVKEHEGVTLRLTTSSTSVIDGFCGNAYRPLYFQQIMRDWYGYGAAVVGTSSHGGVYHGEEMLAFDVWNWADIGWAKFKHYAEKHGFITNFVSPTELWHIGIRNPFRPTAASLDATPITPEEEEDDMPANVMHHTTHPDFKYHVSVSNPGSGFYLSYVTNDPDLNNAIAKQYNTGPSQKVSRSLFRAIERECRALQPRGDVKVTLANADG